MAFVSVVIYIVGGGSLALLGSMFGAGVFVLFAFLKPYQMSRIQIWLNPESDPYGAGYNIIQSLLAFVSGGIFGVGFGNSKQKQNL